MADFKPNPYHRRLFSGSVSKRDLSQRMSVLTSKLKAAESFEEPVEITWEEALLLLYTLHR